MTKTAARRVVALMHLPFRLLVTLARAVTVIIVHDILLLQSRLKVRKVGRDQLCLFIQLLVLDAVPASFVSSVF